MRQISKIHFTPEGEVSNYFNFLKKFELRTERPTKKKPTQMSGFIFGGPFGPYFELFLEYY